MTSSPSVSQCLFCREMETAPRAVTSAERHRSERLSPKHHSLTQWVGTRFCLHTGLMMDETGDGTNPPSGPPIKKAKDRDCYHFTTSCPPQLERHQANLLVSR